MQESKCVRVFLSRTLLEFAKKKRKRTDSGSDVDLDITPPRSPRDEGGIPIEKRRSGRNANKQRKYVDEIDLNLSDDDNLMSSLPAEFASAATSESKPESKVPSAVPSVINEDSTLNGDVTQNSELNMDESSKQQSETDIHSGPNYAYIVSFLCTKMLLFDLLVPMVMGKLALMVFSHTLMTAVSILPVLYRLCFSFTLTHF